MAPTSRQGAFAFRRPDRNGQWRGGRREGAGRKPKGRKAGVPHRRREVLKLRTPLHVTVRCGEGVRRLRRWKVAQVLGRAFRGGCSRDGFRICHFSLQGNHIHLVVEADSAAAMSNGMKAWTIRVARAINRALGRDGKVFPDRYHAVRLKTARQVRAALCYVLQNARRHGLDVPVGAPDPFSSAWWFSGWTHQRWRAGLKAPPEGSSVAAAEGWLLTTGWRRWGLIGVDEAPAAGRWRPRVSSGA
ncbi:MAG TPA: transposase [Kofleriaceae bacterium]|nr:transposase [Kofleriaceae bacterium]